MTKTIKAKLTLGTDVRYITGANKGTLYEKAIAFTLADGGSRYPLANYKDRPDMATVQGLGIQAKAQDGTPGYKPFKGQPIQDGLTEWVNGENASHLCIEILKSAKYPNHSVFIDKEEYLRISRKFDIADLLIREDINKEKELVYRIKMSGATARKYFEKSIIQHCKIEIY